MDFEYRFGSEVTMAVTTPISLLESCHSVQAPSKMPELHLCKHLKPFDLSCWLDENGRPGIF